MRYQDLTLSMDPIDGNIEETGPEVIKLIFVLSSAEHEILYAHKYKSIKNQHFFGFKCA